MVIAGAVALILGLSGGPTPRAVAQSDLGAGQAVDGSDPLGDPPPMRSLTSRSGVSQAIEGLLVPKIDIAPRVDGCPNLETEYPNAASFEWSYDASGSNPPAIVRMVHTATDLFVAVGPMSPDRVVGDIDGQLVSTGIFLDPSYTRDVTATVEHKLAVRELIEQEPFSPRSSIGLIADDLPSTQTTSASYVGNGRGDYQPCSLPSLASKCAFASQISVSTARAVSLDACPDRGGTGKKFIYREYRIPGSVLGDFGGQDGLAVGRVPFTETSVSAGRSLMGPASATWNSPATWAILSYASETTPVLKAQIHVKGHVYDAVVARDRSHPMAGIPIELTMNGMKYSTITNVEGGYEFSVTGRRSDPDNVELRMKWCSFCKLEQTALVYRDGIQPKYSSESTVGYPSCGSETCSYATADFFLRTPPGSIELYGTQQTSPVPSLDLLPDGKSLIVPREATRDRIGRTIRIRGQNLHEYVNVYLTPEQFGVNFQCDPRGHLCRNVHWTTYEARVVNVAPDGSWLDAEIPVLPSKTTLVSPSTKLHDSVNFRWMWYIRDNWSRPSRYLINISKLFSLNTDPIYPYVWGFGFENKGTSHGPHDFAATYGWSAYSCIVWIPFEGCVTHVQDPIYWLIWYPVYEVFDEFFWQKKGTCTGLAATSTLLRTGYIPLDVMNGESSTLPGGLTRWGSRDYDNNCFAGILRCPPRPANIWAYIHMNHGVQTSWQFLKTLLGQKLLDTMRPTLLRVGNHSDPQDSLRKLRLQPFGYEVLMWRGWTAHTVTPYGPGGEANQIAIYDNNKPYAEKEVTFNTENWKFKYDGLDAMKSEGWGFWTIPISVFKDDRNMPGYGWIKDKGEEIFMFAFGDADPLYESSDGHQWGWKKDGTYVDDLPGAVAMPIFGQEGQEPEKGTPLAWTAEGPPPHVTLNSRGGRYLFHTGMDGRLFQLDARNVPPGEGDRIDLGYASGRVMSMRLQTESERNALLPKIGLNFGDEKLAVFRWQNLTTDAAGGNLEFGALRESFGVQLDNRTRSTTHHHLVLDTVDGRASVTSTRLFGPFTVPPGAQHRTFIEDWPQATRMRSEIDVDGDGRPDEISVVTGVDCPSDDANGNGLPDDCERPPLMAPEPSVTASVSATPQPTATSQPTATPQPTELPTSTATPRPTAPSSRTPTPSPTVTIRPTATASRLPTALSTATAITRATTTLTPVSPQSRIALPLLITRHVLR